jgi:hypothetical protein
MASYATIRKCLVVLMSLQRDSTAESSCSTMYRVVKREAWEINVRQGVNVAHLFVRKMLHGKSEKCATFSTALHANPAMMPCRCLRTTRGRVSQCRNVEERDVALLRGSTERYWMVARVSWMSRSFRGGHLKDYPFRNWIVKSSLIMGQRWINF